MGGESIKPKTPPGFPMYLWQSEQLMCRRLVADDVEANGNSTVRNHTHEDPSACGSSSRAAKLPCVLSLGSWLSWLLALGLRIFRRLAIGLRVHGLVSVFCILLLSIRRTQDEFSIFPFLVPMNRKALC